MIICGVIYVHMYYMFIYGVIYTHMCNICSYMPYIKSYMFKSIICEVRFVCKNHIINYI